MGRDTFFVFVIFAAITALYGYFTGLAASECFDRVYFFGVGIFTFWLVHGKKYIRKE
jgi:hypothetical protein